MKGYHVLQTATTARRSYAITFGLKEGYSGRTRVHKPNEALKVAEDWIKRQIAAGKPFLTGLFSNETLVYDWNDAKQGPIAKNEPALVFHGNVSITYLPHLPDQDVVAMLNDLASCFGRAFGQVRVYIDYCGTTWVIEADGKTSPRGPHQT